MRKNIKVDTIDRRMIRSLFMFLNLLSTIYTVSQNAVNPIKSDTAIKYVLGRKNIKKITIGIKTNAEITLFNIKG